MIERIAIETTMDSTGAYQDSGRAELEKRIARSRRWRVKSHVTVQSVKSLIAELEQTLSRIDDKQGRLSWRGGQVQ